MTNEMKNSKGKVIAEVNASFKLYEVRRLAHRGEFVNVGRLFTDREICNLKAWAAKQKELPTWEQWKKALTKKTLRG